MIVSKIGVGFDLDHTIAIDNKLERVAFLRLLEPLTNDGGTILGTMNDEIARIDELLARQRNGEFSIDEAVTRFVRERGVTSREGIYIERFRTMALAMVEEFVVPLPGAKATFERLRELGVAAAVLSNGWNPLQVLKARRAGFDGPVIASAEIGAQKPDPRAFAALIAVLGTQPERTWYVGDDPRADVAGARAAGLHAVWLDAEATPFPPGVPAPARVIVALNEVTEIVASSPVP